MKKMFYLEQQPDEAGWRESDLRSTPPRPEPAGPPPLSDLGSFLAEK